MAVGDRDDMRVVHPGWTPDRSPRDRRPGRRVLPAAAAGLLLATAAFTAALGRAADQIPDAPPAFPDTVVDAPPPPPPPAAPTVAAWDEDSPQVHPPTSPTVAARVAGPAETAPECRVDDLSIVSDGWDRAVGNGWAGVTATNVGPAPCLLGGWPTLGVVQTRRLALTFAQTDTPGSHGGATAAPPRVLLPPRAGARLDLWWRGYGTRADGRTPQRLVVRFGAGEWRRVPTPADVGVAPFDLVDGADVEIGPWRPITP